MSIINSISNCRRPIGSGVGRNAYYSKKYNLVFKISSGNDQQSQEERKLFMDMPERYRKFFPVVDFIDHPKLGIVVLMQRVTTIRELYNQSNDINERCILAISGLNEKDVECLINHLDLDTTLEEWTDFVEFSGCCDLHFGNIGILGNRLVAIDLGI